MQKIERKALREEVYNRLKAAILARKLPFGSPLTEIGLSRRLGVSRTPLREALLQLEGTGLVTSEVNRGFSIFRLEADAVGDIYPMIGALEALALRLTDKNRLPLLAARLREINHELSAQSLGAAQQSRLDRRWHELLYSECGNDRLAEALENLRNQAVCFDGAETRGLAAPKRSIAEHAAIAEALASGRTGQAAALVESHWRGGIETVVEWLRSADRSGYRNRQAASG